MDPPSVFPDGVELSRLIARAQLTLAQAVELAAAVASEMVRRSGPDAATPGRGAVPVGPVLVGADGRVVRGAAADGGPDRASPAADGGAGALLAGIADAARPRAAGPAAEQLLAGLDGAVAELPDAGVDAVARTLRQVAGAIDRRAVRAEIGALVRAIGADASRAGSAPAAGAGSTPIRATASGRTGTARPGTARRRIGAWLLSVLVLAGVVLFEIGFLRNHISADIRLLLDAGRGGSAASTSAAAKPDGRPVAAPAPASAGAVAGVDLRALSPCSPGAPCGVRIEVRLTPQAGQQVVSWSYRVVDRCTGAASTAPGGSVTLPALAQRAAAVGTVTLPAAPGVALVAVTGKPAAAASAPVAVGSCRSHP